MAQGNDELVFAPLGGLGEIGMNAALFGFGPAYKRKWIMIDLGLAFAGPDLPGVDLVLPDIAFVEKIKKDLLALVITHAHEDHIGAIADLWPRLNCPVYATKFAVGLLEARRLSEPGAPRVTFHEVAQGSRFELGPFSIEYVPMSHSIPESNALAIRTPLGTVLHSGDWKFDPTPVIGLPTDEARLRAIGDEGVLALISDSTNILREGESPSEAEVAKTLKGLIGKARGRVVVTTFASNVARLRSVAEAARAAGRDVVVVGRAMDRVIAVARECGYLDGVPAFLPPMAYRNLTRDRVVVLATGSQGEPRAALARIGENQHPEVKLDRDDTVIFSSRTIPGNEKAVNDIINGLVMQNVEVITDRDALVHASGHPRRSEVSRLYDWVRPQVAIPTHGEALHLSEHAKLARQKGVPNVFNAHNGDLVLLAPGEPGVIDEVPHGRLYKDGEIVLAPDGEAVRQRRGLGFAGVISVGVALTSKGDVVGDPDVAVAGIPARTRDGKAMDALIDRAIFETLDSLPRAVRRDADAAASAIERAVKNTVRAVWGKRPTVHVLIMEV
jgi:ribonuclease J